MQNLDEDPPLDWGSAKFAFPQKLFMRWNTLESSQSPPESYFLSELPDTLHLEYRIDRKLVGKCRLFPVNIGLSARFILWLVYHMNHM